MRGPLGVRAFPQSADDEALVGRIVDPPAEARRHRRVRRHRLEEVRFRDESPRRRFAPAHLLLVEAGSQRQHHRLEGKVVALVRGQHDALLLRPDQRDKAGRAIADDEDRLHGAGRRIELDAGDLADAEVLRIDHIVFGVGAVLRRGEALLAALELTEWKDRRHLRRILLINRDHARRLRLAADAVVLDHDPVAHDARRGPVALTGLQIGDDPGLILRELLRRRVPEVAERMNMRRHIDRNLAVERRDAVGNAGGFRHLDAVEDS